MNVAYNRQNLIPFRNVNITSGKEQFGTLHSTVHLSHYSSQAPKCRSVDWRQEKKKGVAYCIAEYVLLIVDECSFTAYREMCLPLQTSYFKHK